MRQRCARVARRFFLAGVCCAWIAGCDRSPAPSGGAPAKAAPTVVSLVPAATDLILGMGAGDHLVAVSNWDPERAEIAGLPRVGDYRTVDWERIAQLRPSVMIVQFREDKMPPGMSQRAESLGIKLVNVRINRLDEVLGAIQTVGNAIGEPLKSTEAQDRLRKQLDGVRQRVAGKERVRTLISRTGRGFDVVAGGNFLDDILTVAGGVNVLPEGDNSYPSIDREMLVSLNPQVVLQLLPAASMQEIEQARAFWKTMPQVAAVQYDRVYFLTEPYLLLPGFSVGKIAEHFADRLHPQSHAKDRS